MVNDFTAKNNALVVSASGDTKYPTITSAKNAASYGQTIVVMPGLYKENDLLKNGVNYHFMLGAIIKWTEPGIDSSSPGYGIFDDRSSGAVKCKITGDVDIDYAGAETTTLAVKPGTGGTQVFVNINAKGPIVISNANSDVSIEVRNISAFGFVGQAITGCVCLSATRFFFRADYIFSKDDGTVYPLKDPDDPEGPPVNFQSGGQGVYWEKGEFHSNVRRIKEITYCLWGHEPAGNPTANWYHESEHIESISSAAYYNDGLGSNMQWRTWVKIGQILTGSLPVNFIGSGRHYLEVGKIQNTVNAGAIQLSGAVECWLTAQKLSAPNATNGIIDILSGFTGTLWARIEHIEDITSSSIGIGSRGTGRLFIECQNIKVLNGVGVLHTGGTLRLVGAHIDTSNTNNANNIPVSVSAAGVILRNCILVAPALADSVKGDASRTITSYNNYANKAKNANITVNVQAITVDANVV